MEILQWHFPQSHNFRKKTRIGFENYNLAQLLWDITDVV